jgi:hypothetical protein
VLRPRGRAPDTPRNRARQREEDATIALLRQQQEIMPQMVEQQQRTRPVQVPAVEGGVPAPPPIEVRPPSPAPPEHNVPEPPVDLVVAPRTPERAPDPEAQPEAADWRRIALAMATSAAKAAGRRPTFAGLDTENPAEFLECERYSTDAQVPPEKKLSEAIRCLRQTATRWAQFHQGKWQRFTEFRAEFLATYWSAGQQLAVRARVLSQRYNLTKVDSTVDFFMEQATQLRTLTTHLGVCHGGGPNATFSGKHLVAVQVGKATRREVHPRGSGFPGATVLLLPPKRQRTKFASRKRTGEAPHRTGPTPQAPLQRMVSSAAVGETKRLNPFYVPTPTSHQSGNDDRTWTGGVPIH